MASPPKLRSISSILYGHLLRECPKKTQKYEAGTSSKSSFNKDKISNNNGEDESLPVFKCPRLTRSVLNKYCGPIQLQGEGSQPHELSSGIKRKKKKEANQAKIQPKSSKKLTNIYCINSKAVSEGFGVAKTKADGTEPGQDFVSCQMGSSKHRRTCYSPNSVSGEEQQHLKSRDHTKRKAAVQHGSSQNGPAVCSSSRSARNGSNKRSRGRPRKGLNFTEISASTHDSLEHEYVKAGTVVWGTIVKSRWWPGIAFDGTLAGEKPARDGHAWIMWFGDHKISQMNVNGLELFSEKYIDRCSGNLPSVLRRAILQAIMFCTKRAGIEAENSSGDSFSVVTNKFLNLILNDKACKDPSLPCDGEQMPLWFGHKLKVLREKKSQLLTEINERKCFSCQGYYTLVCKHPLFQREICKECKERLQESLFAMDTDGSDMFCCMCGFGYDSVMFVCAAESCKRSFCRNCLTNYIKEELCQKIEKQREWICFLCTPYKRETHGSIKPDTEHKLSVLQFYKPTKLPLQQLLENRDKLSPEKIRVLSMCDGIGTLKLILDDLCIGIDTYYSAEADVDALAVSSRHHGSVINQLGDMRTVTSVKMKNFLPIDLMVCCPPDPNVMENSQNLVGTGKVSSILKFAVMVKDMKVIAEGRPYLWLLVTTPSLPVTLQKALTNIFCVEPCFWSCEFIEDCPYIKPRLCWSNIREIYEEATNQKIMDVEKSGIKLDWENFIGSDTECQKAGSSHDDGLKVDSKEPWTCNKEKGKAATEMINVTTCTNYQSKTKMLRASSTQNGDIGFNVDEIERCMGFPTGYTKDVGLASQQRAALLKEAPCPRMLQVLLQPLTKYFKCCHSQ